MSWAQSGHLFDAAFPMAVITLAVMVILRALCRMTRTEPEQLIGVKPSVTPFESREEFLKARLEMDLELFLDKARITPHSITRGIPVSKEVTQNIRTLSTMEILQRQLAEIKNQPLVTPGILEKFPPGTCGQAGTPAGGSGGSFYDLFGSPGSAGGSGQAGCQGVQGVSCVTQFAPGVLGSEKLTVKKGCWYRLLQTGELMRLMDFSNDLAIFYMGGTRQYTGTFSEVELASPKNGETWTFKPCSLHNPSDCSKTFTMNWQFSGAWAKEVLCGCLEPFEFGKGKI